MDANIKVRERFGFGTELVGGEVSGEFRIDCPGMGLYAPVSYVKYLFVVAFCVPLFPIGCYRVLRSYTRNDERIVGVEKAKASELIIIYIREILASPIKLLLWPVVVIQQLLAK